jgi:hypothetical protein
MQSGAEGNPLESPKPSAAVDGSSFGGRVREHKIIQWGLAYALDTDHLGREAPYKVF